MENWSLKFMKGITVMCCFTEENKTSYRRNII